MKSYLHFYFLFGELMFKIFKDVITTKQGQSENKMDAINRLHLDRKIQKVDTVFSTQ